MNFSEGLRDLGVEIIELAKSGINLVANTVPIVAREALVYWTMMAVFNVIFSGIICIFTFFITKYFWKEFNIIGNYELLQKGPDYEKRKMQNQNSTEVFMLALSIINTVVCLVSLGILILKFIPDAIKAFIAPNLFFIEQAASLFK